jgi:16S rRNA G527 N7-methylase RsmG
MLANWASANGLALTRRQLDRFGLYGDLLIEWNRKINLTAITDERGIVVKHFMDSLCAAKLIGGDLRGGNLNGGAKILDVGSGAGFPGIPLSICCQSDDGACGSGGANGLSGSPDNPNRGPYGGLGELSDPSGKPGGSGDLAGRASGSPSGPGDPNRGPYGGLGELSDPSGNLGGSCDSGDGPCGGSGAPGGAGPAEVAGVAGAGRAVAEVTLIDSVGKKVRFLDEVIGRLGLERCTAIHARAEDAARQGRHREAYGVVTARALAAMPVLLEYCLPFVAPGGRLIAMKGQKMQADSELAVSGNALRLLGGRLERVVEMRLPPDALAAPDAPDASEAGGLERTLAVFAKTGRTPAAYPRKAGTAHKSPLR